MLVVVLSAFLEDGSWVVVWVGRVAQMFGQYFG